MLTDDRLRDLFSAGYETSDGDFVAHPQEKMSRTVFFMAQALAQRSQYTYVSSVDLQSEIDDQLRMSATATAKGFNPVDWFSAQWTLAVDGRASTPNFADEYRELFERGGENPTSYRLKPSLYDSVIRVLSELRSSKRPASTGQSNTLDAQAPTAPRGSNGDTTSVIGQGDAALDLSRLAEQLDKEGVFDPNSLEDACTRALRSVIVRKGQPQFREALIEEYGGRCALTRCDAAPALEAAHILPYAGVTTNAVNNGILFRADIHTLFDLDLIGIDPSGSFTRISSQLRGTVYFGFDGTPLNTPKNPSAAPNPVALAWRWKRFLIQR